MQRAHEKRWEYEAVVIGQEGTLTHVPITANTIRAYALAVQHHHTRYVSPETDTKYPQAVVAMPTMVLAYAPLLRSNIAAHSGSGVGVIVPPALLLQWRQPRDAGHRTLSRRRCGDDAG